MNLSAAEVHITAALARMATLYGKPVFDEWLIVSLQASSGSIRTYQGPRPESFHKGFGEDAGPLRAEMEGKHLAVGDFEFAPEASGTRFDACIRVGASSYLLCNHTVKSMAEIRSDSKWLRAQKPFVELSAKFRDDPLE
jgi:hypothetical protein